MILTRWICLSPKENLPRGELWFPGLVAHMAWLLESRCVTPTMHTSDLLDLLYLPCKPRTTSPFLNRFFSTKYQSTHAAVQQFDTSAESWVCVWHALACRMGFRTHPADIILAVWSKLSPDRTQIAAQEEQSVLFFFQKKCYVRTYLEPYKITA